MTAPSRLWLALAAMLAAPFIGYGIVYLGAGPDARQAEGQSLPPPEIIRQAVLTDPIEAGDFSLTDNRGRVFDAKAFEGKWSFVLFGYTHCPDVCPFTLTNMAYIREAMAATLPEQELPQFVFISVDPARDRPENLDDYISYFDPAFRAATGSIDQVDKLVKQVGAYYRHERKNADGEYEVTHSAEIFVFDPKARLFATLQPPLDPKDITHRFRALTAHFQAAGGANS